MVEAQKTEKRILNEDAVPTRVKDTVKVFDKETEKKIEEYVNKLIAEGSLILPKEDAWMAKEIALRAGRGPGMGWVVDIDDIPLPIGGKHLVIVARIRGVE